MAISVNEAKLEMALLNSNVIDLDQIDVFTRFTNFGLPSEIIFRLEELWEQTKVVGGKLVHIGRIIINKILSFIENNPNLAIGVALGAAIGALVSAIPFLGPMLAPLSILLGAIFGGIVGSRLDREKKPVHWMEDISQEVIILAKKFFEFFAAIFIAIKDDFNKSTHE
ncbi:MAG: DUF2273 domain-containing protein [Chlorobium sp.]|jgi:hypothetical protein|nr:DUF2273 domain-containing protein [Chlorobium sp.]